MWKRAVLAVPLLLCSSLWLMLIGRATAQQTAPSADVAQKELPLLPYDPNYSSSLECHMTCNLTQPRSPEANLTLIPPSSRPAIPAGSLRLDVTIYFDGFEKGNFAILSSLAQPRGCFESSGRPPNAPPPGLHVCVTRVGNGQPSPMHDRAITVQGLEPGLNYFWRVLSATASGWITSEVVRCQAPVCPVDFQPEASIPR
jgi:hypothetical protein